MYRFAICDDNEADLALVHSLVEEWALATGNGADIEDYSSAEHFLFAYEEKRDVDVLLLDIEMEGMSGMELARKIRQKDRQIQLIFITGYMEYFSDGYDVEALHYLLKPVNREKFMQVMERAKQRLKTREKMLNLILPSEIVRIPLYEIRYLEVQRNYVTIHAKENYSVKRTLNDLEKELDESFFRTGRSFIVNLRYIKKVTRLCVILKDGTEIPLSRGQYDTVNQAIIRYF